MKAVGKKNALAQKKAGKGIFAPKTLSSELAAICGAKVMSRPEVTKKIWTYIKAKKLNAGRVITPDATLGKVLGKKLDMERNWPLIHVGLELPLMAWLRGCGSHSLLSF